MVDVSFFFWFWVFVKIGDNKWELYIGNEIFFWINCCWNLEFKIILLSIEYLELFNV